MLSIGSFNEDMQNPDICMDFSKMRSLSTESGNFLLLWSKQDYLAGI